MKILKKSLLIKCLLIISVSIVACENEIANVEYSKKDILMDASIKEIKGKYHGNSKKTFVYGKIKIVGLNKNLVSADLECIFIAFNGKQSEKLYIDSVASKVATNILAINNEISQDVYWIFDLDSFDEGISRETLNFNLGVDSTRNTCFQFK